MNRTVAQTFERYFQPTWDQYLGWENARFVVLDCESTGFDPKRDRIVSIGAVALQHYEMLLDDAFEVFLPIAYNTSAVTVHGITREAAEAKGVDEPVAMERFLHFLRDAVIVGHHVGHDIQMLEEAAYRHFGIKSLPNLSVDTMHLTLRLQDAGVLPVAECPDFSLDGLCQRFGIPPHDRHTAMGDAFLTARIFQILLRKAKKAGFLQLGHLTERHQATEEG